MDTLTPAARNSATPHGLLGQHFHGLDQLMHAALRKRMPALVLAAVAASASAQTDVRVNQLGYEMGQASRAYVMSDAVLTGETFSVMDAAGNAVASGAVGSTTGTWHKFHVYPIDFTVAAAGSYSITVAGSAEASSPDFTVDTPANLYSPALANTLSFYQDERDGPDYIPSALRTAPGHLNDESATVYSTPPVSKNKYTADLSPTGEVMDASGGWWDAGDYLKFVETTSYAVGLMLTGIRDFPDQLGAGSATSNFTDEAAFGLSWLLKMWDDSTQTLHYQVGIGIDFTTSNVRSDHDFWRLPQYDDDATPTSAPGFAGTKQSQLVYIRNRPVFVAGSAGTPVSPNLAGRLAADFALCFQVYQSSQPALADQCLLAAEHVYGLADTSPSGQLLTTSPYGFYDETVWQDDLEWGATELYFALAQGGLPAGLPQTDPSVYLADAGQWASAYIAQRKFDSLNLYDVAGLAHFELYRAMSQAGNPTLAVSQSSLLSSIATLLTTNAPTPADPFDALYTWKYGDSVSHLSGLSVMASEYAYLGGGGGDVTPARRQASGVLGANAWGVSFIIGDGTTYPFCPQHQVANLVGSPNGPGGVLAGAVVEGPNSSPSSGKLTAMLDCGSPKTYKAFNGEGAIYEDFVQSYTTNEPAIDLTAASMLMFAWRIAGAPSGVAMGVAVR